MSQNETSLSGFNRRDFLRGGSLATIMTLLGGVPLVAQRPASAAEEKPAGPKVKCAVIGLGAWGREIVSTLLRLPQADLAVICDTYPAYLRRTGNLAPSAKKTEDYKTILDDKEITAVIIATPTHLHKDIALAALSAGKHVYCEAPLANTVEDARAIATAARDAVKQVFQPGLQNRSDPQLHFLVPFIRSGACGNLALARAQWNKKQSWRTTSPNPEKEKQLNWRLDKAISLGLVGEVGIHQIDQAVWFLNKAPKSVLGFGSLINWNDGRDVPDTVQAVFEFPGGVRLGYDATLANSFEAEYEVYYGSDAAVMVRDNNKAWMFKEVDAPLLGWEVYAKKDQFYRDTGISLRADASKQKSILTKPEDDVADQKTPLSYALESFVGNAAEISNAVEDFVSTYGGSDLAAMKKTLGEITLRPGATWKEGYDATVLAIKANEAITRGDKILFQKEWFELA